jgi:hypothetical protein
VNEKLILKNSWFFSLNSWFMMANQRLIMMGVISYEFFNLLTFKIYYKKSDEWGVSYLKFLRIFHTFSHFIFSVFIVFYALVFSLKSRA